MLNPYNSTAGTYTATTDYRPMQPALTEAERLRLLANKEGQAAATTGLSNQRTDIQTGTNSAQGYLNPYTTAGSTALNSASGVAGRWDPATYQAALQNPEFQAILNTGVRASDQGASAKGNLFGGAHALELNQIGSDLSAKYLDQIYNQNMGIAKLGSENAGLSSANAMSSGTQLGAVSANQGNVDANAALARGDISAQTALEKAKAKVAQSSTAGINNSTGLVNGTGLAQYNPNTNPDPWGNAGAMTSGSLGGAAGGTGGSGGSTSVSGAGGGTKYDPSTGNIFNRAGSLVGGSSSPTTSTMPGAVTSSGTLDLTKYKINNPQTISSLAGKGVSAPALDAAMSDTSNPMSDTIRNAMSQLQYWSGDVGRAAGDQQTQIDRLTSIIGKAVSQYSDPNLKTSMTNNYLAPAGGTSTSAGNYLARGL